MFWVDMAGIPLEELWLTVFRILDELNKVHFFMYKNVSVSGHRLL